MQKGLYWTHFTEAACVRCSPQILSMEMSEIVKKFYSIPSFRKRIGRPKYLLILAERFRLAHCNSFQELVKSFEFRRVMVPGTLSSNIMHYHVAIESQNPLNIVYCLRDITNIDLYKMIIYAMSCFKTNGEKMILDILYFYWQKELSKVGRIPNLGLLYIEASKINANLIIWVLNKT